MFDRIVYQVVVAAALLAAAGAYAAARLNRGHPVRDPPPGRAEVVPNALWLVIGCAAAAWIALVCLGESFTYWDDDMFFAALRGEGQRYGAVWPEVGRFFPLAHQEFTLLSLLDTSGLLYRFVVGLELLLALAVALRAIRAPGVIALVTLAGVAASPSVLTAHLGLIFSERNQILLIALMLYGGCRYLERGRPWAAALAAASSFLMLFYKEASAALVGGASAWLLVSALRRRRGEWHRPLLLSVLFAIGVVGFAGAYLWLVHGRAGPIFLQGRAVSFGVAARAIYTQAWFWAVLATVVVRVVRKREDPMLDGLLLGAAVYGVGIAFLGLQWVYYTAPAAFVAWIYVAAAANDWTTRRARTVAVAACAAVVVASLPKAIDTVREHKAVVGGKADAARFIAEYFSARSALVGDTTPLVLHFPAGGYAGGLLGGYIAAALRVPVIVAVPDGGVDTVVLRCPLLAGVECRYGRARQPGNLVVTFAPHEEEAARRDGLALLFVSPDSVWRNPRFRTSVFLVR